MMSQKRQLSGFEIKTAEVQILNFFADLCNKNDWYYSLAGGTLLGAVRHHGFIPWDDDIDVNMPRDAYNNLISHVGAIDDSTPYKLVGTFGLSLQESPFVKMVDTRVEIIDKYQEQHLNLWIDIFPVDGLPAANSQCKKIYSIAEKFRKVLMMSYANIDEGKSALHIIIKRIYRRVDKRGISGKWCARKLVLLATSVAYGCTDYVGAITWGLYGVGERLLKAGYEEEVEVEFEGHQYHAMSCWDAYLHGIYGDYMKLPPVEKRTSHEIEAWLI